MLVVPGHSQGSVSSGEVFVCRAGEVLGEHRVVPVLSVGGLVPELAVTAGSGCAALGQLGEGAVVAVEKLQSGLGWVPGMCLGWIPGVGSWGCAWGELFRVYLG